MSKISNKLGLVGLFVFTFFIFLYLSFPYGVLKEAVASQVQLATDIGVRIEELGPAFPFGFVAKDVELSGTGGVKLNFKEVGIRLSILQLFLLKLGVNIEAIGMNNGVLDLDLGFGIFKLFGSDGMIPSTVVLKAKSFPLDGIATFAFKQAAAKGAGGPMAGPLLGALGFRGELDGKAKVDIDVKAMPQSTADLNLIFNKAALVLSDPTIGLPDQQFKSAMLKASMASGMLSIQPDTRFTADELELGIDGKVNVKNVIASSDMDLKLLVKLSGGLGEKFGWVMDGISGGASKGGSLNLQIRGTLGAPVTSGM
jgi:hypothetical protein